MVVQLLYISGLFMKSAEAFGTVCVQPDSDSHLCSEHRAEFKYTVYSAISGQYFNFIEAI